MANLKVNAQELDVILGELEGELNTLLADTQNKLSKAREEDGSPSPGMSASAGSPAGSPSASAGGSPAPEGSPSAEGAPAGGPPAPAGAAPSPDMGAGGPPPGAEGVPGEGAPGEGAPGAEGGEGGALDPQALEAEYAQLPLEELKAHYLAAKAALFAAMQGGEAGAGAGAPPAGPGAAAGAPAGAPPAAPPASPSPAASAGGPPMAMSEGRAVAGVSQAGNGGQKQAVAKSEDTDLQAQIDALTKIVSAFVNKPMQKAITGASYVAKSEEPVTKKPVTREGVTAKLNELTRSADLKKSDRDLINRYYEGDVKIDAIEHLLK